MSTGSPSPRTVPPWSPSGWRARSSSGIPPRENDCANGFSMKPLIVPITPPTAGISPSHWGRASPTFCACGIASRPRLHLLAFFLLPLLSSGRIPIPLRKRALVVLVNTAKEEGMFSSLLLGIVAFPLTDIDTHQLLPPNSTVVVELHVRSLASELVLKRIVCLARANSYAKSLSRFQLPDDGVDELSDLLQKIGIDFWTDVERVTMAGKPHPGWSPCIVLSGDFSPRCLQAAVARLE